MPKRERHHSPEPANKRRDRMPKPQSYPKNSGKIENDYRSSRSPTPSKPTFDLGKNAARDTPEKGYTVIMNELKKLFQGRPIHMGVHSSSKDDKIYDAWKLTPDGSVQGKTHHDNTAKLELVSPKFAHLENSETWSTEVRKIFDALKKRGRIDTNLSCGTHIHISPLSRKWKLLELQKLCCCILYFERAFEVLYPEARPQGNENTKEQRVATYRTEARKYWRTWYVRANWTDNSRLNTMAYSNCVDLIMNKKTIDGLWYLMNPLDRGYIDRNYAWNFANLREGEKGTVEYRRPPGVKTDDLCLAWASLAFRFVKAAVQVEDAFCPLGENQSHDPAHVHVNHLQQFLDEFQTEGPPVETGYRRLFETLRGNLEVLPCKDRVRPPGLEDYEADEEAD